MATFKSACKIAMINFAKWKKDYRIWFIFICIALLIHNYLKPLIGLCEREGYTATIYILTMFFESSGVGSGAPKVTLYVGLLLLLCDAPFIHQVVPYSVLRSKRKSWFIGECLYIISVSLLYMLFITIVSSICILPYAVFDNTWGTALEGMVYGSELYSADDFWMMLGAPIPLQKDVIRYLYPDASFLYTFIMGWTTFSLLGMLVYVVSLIKNNIIWGMSIAGAFIFLEPLINILHRDVWWLHRLCPVSWSSLERLDIVDRFNQLNIPMIIGMMVVSFIVLILLGWKISSKKMIELR